MTEGQEPIKKSEDPGRSLLDKQSMGGIVALKGFGFQSRYALVRLVELLPDPDFSAILVEGAEDVELRFERDGKVRRMGIQVKDHRVTAAEAREIIKGLETLAQDSPATWESFVIVCTELGEDLKPIESGLKRYRDAVRDAFYSENDPIIANTRAELAERIEAARLPADFVLDRVAFESDAGRVYKDPEWVRAKVMSGLQENAAGLDHDSAGRIYTELVHLVAVSTGQPILRSQIAEIIAKHHRFTPQLDKSVSVFCGVPDLPRKLVGRAQVIEEIVNRLTSSEPGVIPAVALHGIPGAGKTTLAAAIAHHKSVLEHFSDGVLWAGLGIVGEPLLRLNEWGTALGEDLSNLNEIQDRQAAVERLIGQRKILLVIDDAWDLEAAKSLKVGGPHCGYLVTTRDRVIARGFAGAAHELVVETLADDAALGLLRSLAPEVVQAYPEEVLTLVQSMGGLPLAVELLGGYLSSREENLYPEMFPDVGQAALDELADPERRLALAGVRLGSDGVGVSLRKTIELSMEALTDEARQAFHALGAFASRPAGFSREAAEAVTKAGPKVLAILAARNLLGVEAERLTIHQVLADAARVNLTKEAVHAHREYFLALVNRNREDWRAIEAAWPQIRHGWEQNPDDAGLFEWIWALRVYMSRRGLRQDEIDWNERGLRAAEGNADLREDQGVLFNNIGAVYNYLGQRARALEYYQQALTIMEEIGDRSGLAGTLNNIGAVYDNLGQWTRALEYYQQALPIREEVGDRSGLAVTLSNIGLVYDNLGQRARALEYYQQALPIREEVGDRSGLAVTLNNIGAVYDNLGQWTRALEYYQQALPIREEVGDRSGLAGTLNNIGAVYNNLGQPARA
ncbi:MAG TPA: tetratricopeptide repeat protein, partial [Anaerolineales bacterium]|nr:tetratricopeptide repeat protein [Anaerolineales bacterium]